MALNTGDIKRHNRRLIFSLLVEHGRTTKTDLSAMSGLSNPTVYNIISDMEDRKLIERADEAMEPNVAGRPRQYLRLDGNSRFSLGVRYEGELLCVGLMNLCGRMRAVRVKRVSCSVRELLQRELPPMIDELIEQTRVERERIVGVGLGLNGYEIPGEDLLEAFSRETGLYVLVDKDAFFAVAGEYMSLRQKMDKLLYISLGTTVDCGVMVEGHVLRGKTGQLGSVGRMIMEDDKTLDSLIGRAAMREKFGTPPNHDRAAARAYAVKYMARALHNLMLGCDVEIIVLGGDVAARMGEGAVQAIQDELEKLNGASVCVQRQSCPIPAVLGAAFGVMHNRLDEIVGMDE